VITAEASILISGISDTHVSLKTIASKANHIDEKAGDLSVTEAGVVAGQKAVPDDPDDLVDPDDPDVPDDREGKKSGGRKAINPADQANVNYQAGTLKTFFFFKPPFLIFYSPSNPPSSHQYLQRYAGSE
jgi:hypothetical protein